MTRWSLRRLLGGAQESVGDYRPVTAELAPPAPAQAPAKVRSAEPLPAAARGARPAAAQLEAAVPLTERTWPDICDQFGLHLLVLAEQLRASLDELEADEDDPERLRRLYQVDHAVTRMRRASRDLRTLAGRSEQELAGFTTSLLDIIRMAASGIERYTQVTVGRVTDLAVLGYAADDIGSLMSALLDNATRYSPGTVTVSAHLLDGGSVMFRVEDTGIGIGADQVAALNAAFAGPVPDVDERTGRHTGFPVVHRIARKHSVGVRLAARPLPSSGTVVMVTVPPHLLCEVPAEEAPRRQLPAQGQASPSAARTRRGHRPDPRRVGPAAAATAVGAARAARARPGTPARRAAPPGARQPARGRAAAQVSRARGDADARAAGGGAPRLRRGAERLHPGGRHRCGQRRRHRRRHRRRRGGTAVTNQAALPRDPQDFGWLVDNFAASTPGVMHALIVSADGLPLITAGGMSPDLADPLAAMTSGIISLGNNIAGKVGEAGCDQVMLKFPSGHFLFMGIGSLAGFAVLVREGANIGVVAHQMAQLVDAVGHVLTPQLRDDLRRLNAMTRGAGR